MIDFILEEFPAEEEGAVEQHLERCVACTQRLDDFYTAQDDFPAPAWATQRATFVATLQQRLLGHQGPTIQRAPRGKPGATVSSKIIDLYAYIDRQRHWSPAQTDEYRKRVERHITTLSAVAGEAAAAPVPLDVSELYTPARILWTAVPNTGETRWHLGHAALVSGATLRVVSANGKESWIERGAIRLEGPEVVIDNVQLPPNTSGAFVVTPTDLFELGRSAIFVVNPMPVEIGSWSADELANGHYFVEAWQRKVAEGGSAHELAAFLLLQVFDAMVIAMQHYPLETIDDWGVVQHWTEIIRDLHPWRDFLYQCLKAIPQ
jgi:hypothetical protein